MNKFIRVSFWATVFFGAVVLTSCNNEDPPLPENKVTFQSSSLGLGAAETEVTVNISLVRAAEAAGTVTVKTEATGVVYGQQYTTEPAADASGNIVLNVAADATTASFKVIKAANAAFTETDEINFTITEVSNVFVLGEAKTLKLSFAEIVAANGSMEINGGGAKAPNRVFIDLSGNRQTAVARTAWDLAFSSKADEFRVVLNSTNKMMVRALNKTDLASVTASDTVDFGGQVSVDKIFGVFATSEEFPAWLNTSLSWMDNPAGDLTKTAIAGISSTDSENKVYIVNRGVDGDNKGLGWAKIRVLRSGSNYTLQYANIGDATIKSVTVAKGSTPFSYVSLTSGAVTSVEPQSWDFSWSGFTNTTFTGDDVVPVIPYYFADIVLTNIYGGAAAFVYTTGTTGAKTYDTFTKDDLSVITNYSTSQLAIGSSWRSTGGPGGGTPSVVASKFYILKDSDGNVYKVQFTAITTNGERGKPQFKFELLVKGA